jgi:hypothetical protein
MLSFLYLTAIVALVGLLPTTASAGSIMNLDGLGGPSEVFAPAIANKSATGFEQLGQGTACGGGWGVSAMSSLLMVNGWSGWSRDQILEVAGPVTGLGSQVHLLKLTCDQPGESDEGSAGALNEIFASALHESLAGASNEGFAGALSESFAGPLNASFAGALSQGFAAPAVAPPIGLSAPEPATLSLMAFALVTLGRQLRRRRHSNTAPSLPR